MFTNQDILTLAKAGFNAQQIAALNSIGQQMRQPQVQPQVQPQGQNATIDDVLNSLNGLTQTFQNGFLLNSQQPKPATAEDILAEIINPPTNIKEGGKS